MPAVRDRCSDGQLSAHPTLSEPIQPMLLTGVGFRHSIERALPAIIGRCRLAALRQRNRILSSIAGISTTRFPTRPSL